MTTVIVKDRLDTKILSTALNRKQQFQERNQRKVEGYVLKRPYIDAYNIKTDGYVLERLHT
jgi:hypothetical protein